ncbi:MAG: hypothetical protein H0U76_09730 [Ktedonobacteraceae bacterium]|nr:hypothetical protein [Ktedonobacteraceae bacterium]
MDKSVISSNLEVKYAGAAIEYGTLTLFIENLPVQQPVLVMPLERSILHGSIAIYQWVIHVTTRTGTKSPVAYATFRAAEVKETVLGKRLIFPSQEDWSANAKERADQLQQQFLVCITDLLNQSGRVSQVIVPARHRLPDEWVWSSRCTEERIVSRDGLWTLVHNPLV